MEAPERDLDARKPIWDCMQMFWMDTDPEDFLSQAVDVCAASKYSLEELKDIFWNEVRPAVSFNMTPSAASEWQGFDIEWLAERVLETHRFGKRLPIAWLHRYASGWWAKLEAGIAAKRGERRMSIAT